MPPKHSTKRVVGFLFSLRNISPGFTALMIVSQVIFAVLTTAIAPLFISRLLTQIARGSATMNNSLGLLISYGLVLLIGNVVIVRVTIALAYHAESKMQATVAARVMKHLTHKSMTWHANRMSGGIVSDSQKLNGSIERFWDTLIFNIVPIVTTIISVCIVLGFIFWQYAVILAVLSIIISSVIVRAQSSIAPISRQVAERSSAMTAYFADVMSNIASVKAFAGEKAELSQYKGLIKNWREINLKEMRSVLFISGSFGTMMLVMNICAFAVAIIATEHHIAAIGVVYLVISYTLSVVAQLSAISGTTRNYIRIVGDAGPMITTLDDPIDLTDNENPKKLIVKNSAIEFRDVTFTHDENNEALFHNFNLTIRPGEKIGLVGQSGSGKTTLTKLLLRFNDLDNGEILIDKQSIDSVTQTDLRRHIAYVAQEPVLFHRSLHDNISYGRPDASDRAIMEAAKKSHSIEFIKGLPYGMDTLVGERGVKLSGGQRQRIAIARAILKDAPILVLDEATSALDSESEKLIQDALTKLMKDRTSIVIAHRLSTIAKLDRIIVLDHGEIVEDGTHAELLAAKGTYARLWAHQSGGFIEE